MQTVAYNNYFSKLATAFLKPNDITVMEEKLSHNKLSTNLNLIRTYAIFVFFLNTVANYLQELNYSFIITASATTIFITSHFLKNVKYFNFIRYIFVVTLCVSISALCFVEGVILGDYLYLFVLLITCIFIYDYKDTFHLSIVFLLVTLSFAFIFLYAPINSSLQRINESTERITFMSNIFVSAFITFLISFIILKQNYTNSIFLVQKEQYLNTVFNTSLDAVFVVDGIKMLINSCNKQCLEMFDIKDDGNLIGKNVGVFFKNYKLDKKIDQIFALKNDKWQGELTCTIATGGEFVGYISIVPFMHGNKLLKKISILDITEIKNAQSQLVIAKEKAEHAMKVKSQFLSNMSHELRTPLNGIIGTSNLLLDEASMPEQKEHFNLLKYSSEHMLNLINDVLDFSKIEAEKLELEKQVINLVDFLAKIQQLFASQFSAKGLALHFDIDDKLNRLFIGDETRLSQVLSNLLSNALKFTDKGKVTLAVKIVKSNSKKASIYFSVKDTGLGITEKQQKLIFLSFTQGDTTTTRKYGGTGLGLSISKNIVELYKGELKVESKKGEGSNFYFIIDLEFNLNNRNFVNEKVLGALSNLSEMKLLIAEDNNINMLVARKFLKKWGIVPDEAINGLEALKIIKQKAFDVLLIDLEMPEMDGYELIALIRRANIQVPVIAFTAALYDNMHNDLLQKGFNDYIQKPFRPEDLHRKIAQFANNKNA